MTCYFTNLICENLCCLRYLRAFDTDDSIFQLLIRILNELNALMVIPIDTATVGD